jgi:hypothetical protein
MWEMISPPPKKNNQAIKRMKKVHGVIEYTQKQFQKYFVPGKNTATDKSIIWFKSKIILKAYNTKKNQ